MTRDVILEDLKIFRKLAMSYAELQFKCDEIINLPRTDGNYTRDEVKTLKEAMIQMKAWSEELEERTEVKMIKNL